MDKGKVLKALSEGLSSDKTGFYVETGVKSGFMATIIPYGNAKLVYVAWDNDGDLKPNGTSVINPYLTMDNEGAFLTYVGFYAPQEKTLFLDGYFLFNLVGYDSNLQKRFKEQAKEEFGLNIVWLPDGIREFDKKCQAMLESKLVDDTPYDVTDDEREKITVAYREYLMGFGAVSALWSICMRLGFPDYLFSVEEADFLDYYAGRKTLDDLLWSHMDYFKELHTRRCAYKRESEQLLMDGLVITPQEQSFADAAKKLLADCTLEEAHKIVVMVVFKDDIRIKTELLSLCRHICDRCPLYYTSEDDKHYIDDIDIITLGDNLELLGDVIWKNE